MGQKGVQLFYNSRFGLLSSATQGPQLTPADFASVRFAGYTGSIAIADGVGQEADSAKCAQYMCQTFCAQSRPSVPLSTTLAQTHATLPHILGAAALTVASLTPHTLRIAGTGDVIAIVMERGKMIFNSMPHFSDDSKTTAFRAGNPLPPLFSFETPYTPYTELIISTDGFGRLLANTAWPKLCQHARFAGLKNTLSTLEEFASTLCEADTDSSGMLMSQAIQVRKSLGLSVEDISPLRPESDDRTVAIFLSQSTYR
jgi:hypothetical protein